MTDKAKKYLDNMDNAIGTLLIEPDSIYSGRERHERIARECGTELEDKMMLEELVGRRYETLELLRNDIEILSGKKVNTIIESESDRLEEMDFMIDYEFDLFDIHTLYYLKDNAGRYYITEV